VPVSQPTVMCHGMWTMCGMPCIRSRRRSAAEVRRPGVADASQAWIGDDSTDDWAPERELVSRCEHFPVPGCGLPSVVHCSMDEVHHRLCE